MQTLPLLPPAPLLLLDVVSLPPPAPLVEVLVALVVLVALSLPPQAPSAIVAAATIQRFLRMIRGRYPGGHASRKAAFAPGPPCA
jgi:hypothetical protein